MSQIILTYEIFLKTAYKDLKLSFGNVIQNMSRNGTSNDHLCLGLHLKIYQSGGPVFFSNRAGKIFPTWPTNRSLDSLSEMLLIISRRSVATKISPNLVLMLILWLQITAGISKIT